MQVLRINAHEMQSCRPVLPAPAKSAAAGAGSLAASLFHKLHHGGNSIALAKASCQTSLTLAACRLSPVHPPTCRHNLNIGRVLKTKKNCKQSRPVSVHPTHPPVQPLCELPASSEPPAHTDSCTAGSTSAAAGAAALALSSKGPCCSCC